uniref:Uncharacterized protein n=1 Tax=Ciona intestinalis TaxID=7719 RepID=H2XNF2_CIOIN
MKDLMPTFHVPICKIVLLPKPSFSVTKNHFYFCEFCFTALDYYVAPFFKFFFYGAF